MRVPSVSVLGDWLLAAALSGLAIATLAAQVPGRLGVLEVTVSVLTVAPVALRQSFPVATMGVIAAALGAASLLGYGDLPSGGIGLVIGLFTVANLRPRWVAAVAFVAALAVLLMTYVRITTMFVWSQPAQGALTLFGAWVLGESARQWALRTQRLAAQAERAVADERVRIARELHDVVAHHMSVISLQAGLAEYVLDSDPPTARQAIGVVNRSGREALAEMRRMLDVLRADPDEEASFSPQPGLGDVEDLVRRMGGAGLTVETSVTGAVRELSPGAALCAYRMVQESLTNVLKHAGPAHALVAVDYGERWVDVSVTDDGSGPNGRPSTDASLGIMGMRERANLYGGELSTGPRQGGGFAVRLRLPVEPDS